MNHLVEPELLPDLPPVPLPQLLTPVDAALLLIILVGLAVVGGLGVDAVAVSRLPPLPPALRRLNEERVEGRVRDVLHTLFAAPQRRWAQCRRLRGRRRTPEPNEAEKFQVTRLIYFKNVIIQHCCCSRRF
jgi:hypothetical protein